MGSESSTTVYSLDSPSFMVTVVGSTLTPAAASSSTESWVAAKLNVFSVSFSVSIDWKVTFSRTPE